MDSALASRRCGTSRREFRSAPPGAGRDALAGLPAGAAVLAALAGGRAAVLGIGRRLSEYR